MMKKLQLSSMSLLHNGKAMVPLLVLLCLAGMLKAFYSQADAGELRWILAPTAWCVELLSSRQFVFDGDEGYCSADHRAVIAPVCAGVNFMIIIICMLGVMARKRMRGIAPGLRIICLVLLVAYTGTLCVNTIRIAIALDLYDKSVQFGVLTKERIHRLMGIAVYFSAACVLYIGSSCMLKRQDIRARINSTEKQPNLLVPATWYCGITLGIPLLLGKMSCNKVALAEHALFVAAIPLLVVAVSVVVNIKPGVRKHAEEI